VPYNENAGSIYSVAAKRKSRSMDIYIYRSKFIIQNGLTMEEV